MVAQARSEVGVTRIGRGRRSGHEAIGARRAQGARAARATSQQPLREGSELVGWAST